MEEMTKCNISPRLTLEALSQALLKHIVSMVGTQTISFAIKDNLIFLYAKRNSNDEWMQSLFPELQHILQRSLNRLYFCKCENGCLNCVLPSYDKEVRIKEEDEIHFAKDAVISILQVLLFDE